MGTLQYVTVAVNLYVLTVLFLYGVYLCTYSEPLNKNNSVLFNCLNNRAIFETSLSPRSWAVACPKPLILWPLGRSTGCCYLEWTWPKTSRAISFRKKKKRPPGL
jgi:hypothetical protein